MSVLYDAQIRSSRILLVDDVVSSVTLLQNVLQRLGFKEVRSVTDPREVFAALDEWKPDLIVLDLAMPHIHGLHLLQHLREQETETDFTPVLVLTGNMQPETRRKALQSGASDYLLKPFESSEIVLRIRNLLLVRVLQAELRNQNVLLEEKVAERTKALSERTAQLERALAELKEMETQMLEQERFRASVIEYAGSKLSKKPGPDAKRAS
jgi:CheY-like chemotaxis protein